MFRCHSEIMADVGDAQIDSVYQQDLPETQEVLEVNFPCLLILSIFFCSGYLEPDLI
jgi:hypothetical protein